MATLPAMCTCLNGGFVRPATAWLQSLRNPTACTGRIAHALSGLEQYHGYAYTSAAHASVLAADPGKPSVPDIPIQKLLVANRGEIACRVLATAQRLGIPTVAVFSEADRGAQHVARAGEAFCIGPPAARDSYLCQDRILEVALRSGATAIHPGYGFLSENPTFAELCRREGITFVGPPPAAISAMGDKSEAKAMMKAAGVPVVPGYHGEDQDMARLLTEGGQVGFPLLVKATRGGGGKGMKLARTVDELEEALLSAKREAAASFGDERVLMELFIERSRHLEVQVFADDHNNAVYLFERDCSVQRRHQKVIEEAPAPGISEDFRRSIGGAAVAAARAVGYRNAGTVEFIVDTDTGDYYFMEMNTRLQVEHPVTEAITGQDLVEWQLLVSAGQPLPLTQEQLRLRGHAFEARLYAESPERDFMPGTGTVRHWRVPAGAVFFTHQGDVRVDSGVQQGDEVGVDYDPMIAKVIATGADRTAALASLRKVLGELQVGGLPTNLGFLQRLAAHPAFQAAELDTSFIKQHEAALMSQPRVSDVLAACAALAYHLWQVQQASADVAQDAGPWDMLDSFRLGSPLTQHVSFSHLLSGSQVELDMTLERDGHSGITGEVRTEDATSGIDLAATFATLEGQTLTAQIGEQRITADLIVYPYGEERLLQMWVAGVSHVFHWAVPHRWERSGAAASADGSVVTPMPGKIVKVFVADGETVAAGDPLVVIEAMKMEHTVRAPCSGTVTGLSCFAGQQVQDGHLFATVVSEAAAAVAA